MRPQLACVQLLAISAVALAVLFAPVSIAEELPPEIQVDRLLVQAEREIKDGEHWSAVFTFERILAVCEEHGLAIPTQFWFRQAGVLRSAGLDERAIEASTRYLKEAGRDGKHYQAALKLLDAAQEAVDDARRRAEAERLRIESERRAKLEQQRRNDEQAARQVGAARQALARDALTSGGEGPEMVRIAAGRFQHWATSRTPIRWLSIEAPFAMSKYEVTLGEFRRFAGATRYRTEAERKFGCQGWTSSTHATSSLTWKRPGFEQSATHPVTCVSVSDAIAYTRWLSRETGQVYRLPSAAEWQYAARAGSSASMLYAESTADFRHRKQDANADLCTLGNLYDRSAKVEADYNFLQDKFECDDGATYTAPVGSYAPNEVGLFDMIGNVAEIVLTCNPLKELGGEIESAEPDNVSICPKSYHGYKSLLVRGQSWGDWGGYLYDYYGGAQTMQVTSTSSSMGQGSKHKTYSRNSNRYTGFRIIKELDAVGAEGSD